MKGDKAVDSMIDCMVFNAIFNMISLITQHSVPPIRALHGVSCTNFPHKKTQFIPQSDHQGLTSHIGKPLVAWIEYCVKN